MNKKISSPIINTRTRIIISLKNIIYILNQVKLSPETIKNWCVDLNFQYNLDLQYQVSIKMLPFSLFFQSTSSKILRNLEHITYAFRILHREQCVRDRDFWALWPRPPAKLCNSKPSLTEDGRERVSLQWAAVSKTGPHRSEANSGLLK